MADGSGPRVHRKQRRGAPEGFFACEAAGLAWLRVPGGPPVVSVLDVAPDHLDLVRLSETRPTREAARELGRGLAVVHDAGAPAWGAPPEGWSGDGFFGPLGDPWPMPTGAWDSWAQFYGDARLRVVAEQGRGNGHLTADDGAALDRLADVLAARALEGRDPWATDDVPARSHGDLWSGNVLWTADGATLIDPAAHGTHREYDLAMLALFGAPHLDEIVRGYDETHPLATGWRHRVALHQLYPLGMHAVIFGGGYVGSLRRSVADVTAALTR